MDSDLSPERPRPAMDAPTERLVRLLAVQAAVVTAAVHLAWALPRLAVYLPLGQFADLRPYLFVPASLVLLGVATAELRGVHARRLYSLAVGVLLTFAAGYAWWHLTGHGGLVPGHRAADPVATVLGHLLDDPLAFVAMLAELVGAAAFAALYVLEGRRAGAGTAPPAGDEGSPEGETTDGESTTRSTAER